MHEGPKAPKGLMVVFGRVNLFSAGYLAGQFGGRMDEIGEALGANVDFLPLELQGDERNFLFRFLAVETCFHYINLYELIPSYHLFCRSIGIHRQHTRAR